MSSQQSSNDAAHFEHHSSEFVRWFESRPDARLSTKISLADLRFRDAGRGVVANTDIAEDEELFAIPRSLVLQKTTSEISSHMPETLARLGEWDSLILVIIFEYLRSDASPWFPYLRLLPTYFDSLMFWTPKEVGELQGSAVIDKIGKESAEDGWRHTIIPIMRGNGKFFPVSHAHRGDEGEDEAKEEKMLELAHMAGSMIMAYAFDIEDTGSSESDDDVPDGGESDLTEDEENLSKGLVPFADMLNSDATRNNARLFYENDLLIMKTTKAISGGDEVLNQYGDLPRSDLLRMYGYITDNYSQFDVVEISADLIQNVAASSGADQSFLTEKRRELESLGLIDDAFVIGRPKPGSKLQDLIPVDLRMLITAFCSPADKFNVSEASHHPKESGLSLSEASLLLTIITNRISAYASSLRDDSENLVRLKEKRDLQLQDGKFCKRYEMALQVCKGEKEILYYMLQLLQEHIAQQTQHLARDSAKRKRIEVKPESVSKRLHAD